MNASTVHEPDPRRVARDELRRQVRRFVDSTAGVASARNVISSGLDFDPDVWGRLTGDFSATSIHVPERYGGEGFGFEELAVLLSETGRSLVPSPLLSSATIATTVLLELARDGDEKLLASVASGERRATVAIVEPGTGWHPSTVKTIAEPHAGIVRLSGEKTAVLDAHSDLLLVVARHPGSSGDDGVVVAVVDGEQQGLEVRRLGSLDLTRPLYSLRLSKVPARIVGDLAKSCVPALTTALARATAGLSAEMVGGARRCVESAVQYTQVREQFGRPIGSFQAVKHICANMLAEVELADAVVCDAITTAENNAPELTVLASMAKLLASRAFLFCALESLHLFGGVGFTWENDAHLYVRRAKSSELLLGDQQHHRRVVANYLKIAGSDSETGLTKTKDRGN